MACNNIIPFLSSSSLYENRASTNCITFEISTWLHFTFFQHKNLQQNAILWSWTKFFSSKTISPSFQSIF
jgi:hypothetical protein